MSSISLDDFSAPPVAVGPFSYGGTYPHRFSAGAGKILSAPGVPCRLSSVIINTVDTNTVVRLYEGTNRSGNLIASITCARRITFPFNFSIQGGLFVSVDGGAGAATIVLDAGGLHSDVLTMSGNEISDSTRTTAVKWATTQGTGSVDQFTAPDSSYGVWEAGTNLFRRGQCDATTDWGVNTTGVTPSIDATTPAPFSTQSIKYTYDGVQSSGGTLATTATGQAAAATTLGVGSMWLKGTAGLSFRITLQWRNTDSTSTTGTSTDFVATGNWQFVAAVPLAVAAGKTGDALRLIVTAVTQQAQTFNVAHAMIQSGVNVVSPYVPTTGGATSTRAAARVQAPSSGMTAAQGWVAMRLVPQWSATAPPSSTLSSYLWSWADSASNRIIGYFDPVAVKFKIQRTTSIGNDTSSGPIESFAANTPKTVICTWGANGVQISVDGASFGATSGTHTPTMAAGFIDIGSGGTVAPNEQVDGLVHWLAMGTGALSNTDAATINGFGSTDHLPADFPGNCTFVWPADTSRYYTP